MSNFFVLLFFLSLGMLGWGLIAPQHLAKVSKKDVSRKRAGLVFGGFALLFFVLIGVTAPAQAEKGAPQDKAKTPAAAQETKKPTTTTKREQLTKPLPFTTQTKDDNTLAKGQTKIAQAGVEGVTTTTYEVTFTDGQETSRKLVSEETTTQPVAQITHNGTYVAPAPVSCSNGYVNVNGNCVRSPSTDPAGASAQCRDGTYSYSQNRSGTCSHHGGVTRWL